MLRTSMPMLAGLLLAAVVGASGCTSMNSMSSPNVFRGQDPTMPPIDPGVTAPPMPMPMVDPGVPTQPMVPMVEDSPVTPTEQPMTNTAPVDPSVQPQVQSQPQYVDGGYQQGGYAQGSPGYCPPGGQYPAFVCPRPGGACRPGGNCGNQFDWYPRHHLSYSYSTPRNLSYPTQGAPAGQVAYPYYTLKGPGDFFRQD